MNAGFHCAFRATHNLCDLGYRQVFQKMQDQNLTMLESDFTQRLVKGSGICFRKRRFLGLLEIFKLNFFG